MRLPLVARQIHLAELVRIPLEARQIRLAEQVKLPLAVAQRQPLVHPLL